MAGAGQPLPDHAVPLGDGAWPMRSRQGRLLRRGPEHDRRAGRADRRRHHRDAGGHFVPAAYAVRGPARALRSPHTTRVAGGPTTIHPGTWSCVPYAGPDVAGQADTQLAMVPAAASPRRTRISHQDRRYWQNRLHAIPDFVVPGLYHYRYIRVDVDSLFLEPGVIVVCVGIPGAAVAHERDNRAGFLICTHLAGEPQGAEDIGAG